MNFFIALSQRVAAYASLILMLQSAYANNVQINNLTVLNSTTLRFDLSWENSWRVPYSASHDSYDGVYVFFKYRLSGGTTPFLPLKLFAPTNNQPPGFDAIIPTDCIGEFIYPSVNYSGSPNLTNLTVVLSQSLPFDVDVRAYAIEMVYVAGTDWAHNYHIGDGNGWQESGRAFHLANNESAILPSGQAITVDDEGINVLYEDEFITSIGVRFPENGDYGVLWGTAANAEFPNGFKPFWAMKYEISQAGYRDFLNSLSLLQQGGRSSLSYMSIVSPGGVPGSPALGGTYRNYIELKTLGNQANGTPAVFACDADGDNVYDETTDGEWVACNMLSHEDIYAWLDWAGLTFMTELQFEKLARGMNRPPNFGEYAWGNTSLYIPPGSIYTLTNPSAFNEIANASATLGNANYYNSYPIVNGVGGPIRSGIFGTSNSTRTTSGAAYYGAMELCGNVTEICVSIGNTTSRNFRYKYGNVVSDGILANDGKGNYLPYYYNEVYRFFIFRGGNWESPLERLRISDRSGGFPAASPERTPYNGGRGVFNIY